MTYATFFEIGGRVVESITPCPSIMASVPPVVNQADQQPERAVDPGQAKRIAASPEKLYQPTYTVGVFQGNPFLWLGGSVLIRAAQILQPETQTLAY